MKLHNTMCINKFLSIYLRSIPLTRRPRGPVDPVHRRVRRRQDGEHEEGDPVPGLRGGLQAQVQRGKSRPGPTRPPSTGTSLACEFNVHSPRSNRIARALERLSPRQQAVAPNRALFHRILASVKATLCARGRIDQSRSLPRFAESATADRLFSALMLYNVVLQ